MQMYSLGPDTKACRPVLSRRVVGRPPPHDGRAAPTDCKAPHRPRKGLNPSAGGPRPNRAPAGPPAPRRGARALFPVPEVHLMAASWFVRFLKERSRPSGKRPARRRPLPSLEPLGERILPAVTAVFSPGTQIL